MISGKGLKALIGSNRIEGCYQWTFRETAQELDATDGTSGGYDVPETGILSGTITGRAFYDVGNGAWTPVKAGTEIVNLGLFVTDHVSDKAVDIPLARVTEFEITAEVKGRIEFSFTAKTVGAYTVSEVAA